MNRNLPSFFLLIGALLLFSLPKSFAQVEEPLKKAEKKPFKNGFLSKEIAFGGGLYTKGFNLMMDYGFIKKTRLTRFFHIELAELKHPKERRQTRDISFASFTSPKSFVFGKQNALYNLSAGYGVKHYLSDKAEKRGIAIGVMYSAGPTLGFAKPYYVDVPNPNDPRPQPEIISIRYTEENEPLFLGPSIYGSSGMGYGWDEVKVYPGAYARAGLLFDWGAYDEFVKAAEVGVLINGYFKEVPIMVTENNQQFFVNLYANFVFGKRWK